MKYLNFDFNFKLLLKMYAGQVNIFGYDYFSLIFTKFNAKIDILTE
jgi:hypothetical protein